jgi:MraZ protein
MVFLGKFEYAMDERGRVPIPPKFREALVLGIFLTEGTPDRCIRAYSPEEFEKASLNYTSQPITTAAGRVMRRNFFSTAFQAELDRQGRVLIPAPLRQHAGLEGQITILGTGEAFEIWNSATLDAALADEATEYRQTLGSE